MLAKPTKKKKKRVFTPTPDGPKVCQGCGIEYGLEIHHVYNKSARNFSSENKCVEWLCNECHRGVNGVHGTNCNRKLNTRLKKKHQTRLENEGMTRLEFIFFVGRNYI